MLRPLATKRFIRSSAVPSRVVGSVHVEADSYSSGPLALMRALSLIFLAALSLAGSERVGAATPQQPIPDHFLYVCVQDEAAIAIVDMDALEVVGFVRLSELGFGDRAAPHDVAVSPDGLRWYVSLIGEHRVLQFDEQNRLLAAAEMETPGMVGLDPTGERLMVSRSMSAANPPRLVGLGSAEGMLLEEVDVVFPRPHAVAFGLDGRHAYTASLATNQLAALELASDRVVLVDVEGPPQAFVQFAVSPDGETLVASGELSGQLNVFSLDDPARPRFVTSVPLGPMPFDPVFSPDGRRVWVPLKGANEVAVVGTSDWTVSSRITGAGIRQPHAIEFSPDGSRAFVTNNAVGAVTGAPDLDQVSTEPAQLVVIDAETLQVEVSLALGRNLTGLGRRPAR